MALLLLTLVFVRGPCLVLLVQPTAGDLWLLANLRQNQVEGILLLTNLRQIEGLQLVFLPHLHHRLLTQVFCA